MRIRSVGGGREEVCVNCGCSNGNIGISYHLPGLNKSELIEIDRNPDPEEGRWASLDGHHDHPLALDYRSLEKLISLFNALSSGPPCMLSWDLVLGTG
jgi:hypothetical protein